ncbi:hypothetical protein LLG95_10650 [bacterium]|nr:hypothetical protein [bacterium]
MSVNELLTGRLSKAELKAAMAPVLDRCMDSTREFALTFLPETFFRPFSVPHEKIFFLMDESKKQKRLMIAPRGIGKSSITKAFILRRIEFGLSKCVVYISASGELATNFCENIKQELEENELLLKVFGPQKTAKWSQDRWVTKNGAIVIPRGAGQQVRGLLFKHIRPDLVVIDDLDNELSVATPELRMKTMKWLQGSVLNIVDRGSDDYMILHIGTMLHEDSAIARQAKDEAWDSETIAICDDNYKSNFPEFMGDAAIAEEVAQHRRMGTMDVFAREYMSIPMASEDRMFDYDMFRQYDEAALGQVARRLEHFVLCDPAKTHEEYSCDTAVGCGAFDWRTGKVYGRDLALGKMTPEELYESIYSMIQRYNARIVGVEVTSLNEFITRPLKDYLLAKRCYVQIVELQARGRKDDRIRALQPYYKAGMIEHSPAMKPLEHQLVAHPHGRRKDAADMWAYIVELLDLSGRVFGGAERGEDDEEDLEAKYRELESREDPELAEWRVA